MRPPHLHRLGAVADGAPPALWLKPDAPAAPAAPAAARGGEPGTPGPPGQTRPWAALVHLRAAHPHPVGTAARWLRWRAPPRLAAGCRPGQPGRRRPARRSGQWSQWLPPGPLASPGCPTRLARQVGGSTSGLSRRRGSASSRRERRRLPEMSAEPLLGQATGALAPPALAGLSPAPALALPASLAGILAGSPRQRRRRQNYSGASNRQDQREGATVQQGAGFTTTR